MKSERSGDYRFAATLALCGPCREDLDGGAIDAAIFRVDATAGLDSRNAKRRQRQSVLAFMDARQGPPEAV